jgi:hypothetical protein
MFYFKETRSAFLRACHGLWFPDPNIKYEVYQLTSDIIAQLKPAERLMIFAKMFKSLHLHHRHGLCFRDLETEKVLVYLRGGQIVCIIILSLSFVFFQNFVAFSLSLLY